MKSISSPSLSPFEKRRAQLLDQLPVGALVLISNTSEVTRNGDTYYPYRPNSYFYYLTGFSEPGAIAVLQSTSQGRQFILFNAPQDPIKARWVGSSIGQLGACMTYGANAAYPIGEFSKHLTHLLEKFTSVYFLFKQDPVIKAYLKKSGWKLPKKPTDNKIPTAYHLHHYLDEMRLIKQADEIQALKKAAQVSAKAHKRAMQNCRPGLYEYQIEAELLHEFYQNGCRSTAYESIVATGENACVLHYTKNQSLLKSNQLLLIDAGCEYQYYASDITRTFPVNGRFTPEQRLLYQLVLDTQMTVIRAIKPGISWETLEHLMAQTLTEGLQSLKILTGETSSLLEQRAYRRFCPHSLGHWLGLDVHDVGNYGTPKGKRCLEPGMTLTIEPGIYITEDMIDIEAKWRGIGIRIEDDILVTHMGYEVLSQEAPKTIEEIEVLCMSSA